MIGTSIMQVEKASLLVIMEDWDSRRSLGGKSDREEEND